jgi:flagellar motor switch protein FliM
MDDKKVDETNNASVEGEEETYQNNEGVADEWEAMLEKEDHSKGNLDDDIDALFDSAPSQGEGASERLLSQNEIDSLLGFDSSGHHEDKTGIEALLSSDMIYYERLPMLEVVFDRLVRLMTTSLRNFTSDTVEVTLESISTVRFGDFLNTISLPAMISVFRAVEWENYGIVCVDSPLIYSIVDVLLGGRKGMSALRVDGRPYTTIERSLIERLVEVFLNDLSTSFEPVSPIKFSFDRLETNPRFATIGRHSNAAIRVDFYVDMDDRGGKIQLSLPYATLEPIRELLLQNFMGEKFGRDSIWETHLGNELWTTGVNIKALLDRVKIPLGEVLNLKVGSQIFLNTQLDKPITIMCGQKEVYQGKLGRKGKNMAICIEKNLMVEGAAQ